MTVTDVDDNKLISQILLYIFEKQTFIRGIILRDEI